MLHWIAFTVIGLFMVGSYLRTTLGPGPHPKEPPEGGRDADRDGDRGGNGG